MYVYSSVCMCFYFCMCMCACVHVCMCVFSGIAMDSHTNVAHSSMSSMSKVSISGRTVGVDMVSFTGTPFHLRLQTDSHFSYALLRRTICDLPLSQLHIPLGVDLNASSVEVAFKAACSSCGEKIRVKLVEQPVGDSGRRQFFRRTTHSCWASAVANRSPVNNIVGASTVHMWRDILKNGPILHFGRTSWGFTGRERNLPIRTGAQPGQELISQLQSMTHAEDRSRPSSPFPDSFPRVIPEHRVADDDDPPPHNVIDPPSRGQITSVDAGTNTTTVRTVDAGTNTTTPQMVSVGVQWEDPPRARAPRELHRDEKGRFLSTRAATNRTIASRIYARFCEQVARERERDRD